MLQHSRSAFEDWIDRKRLFIGENEDLISMVFHIIQKAGTPL